MLNEISRSTKLSNLTSQRLIADKLIQLHAQRECEGFTKSFLRQGDNDASPCCRLVFLDYSWRLALNLNYGFIYRIPLLISFRSLVSRSDSFGDRSPRELSARIIIRVKASWLVPVDWDLA